MNLNVRNFHPSDLCDLYNICLKTGASGEDASELYNDKLLLGHFYAAPYAVLEPDCTFIFTINEKPVGYILGTKNSLQFEKSSNELWFNQLKIRYPKPSEIEKNPDANIMRLIHRGHTVKEELIPYDAHLHIDILPEGQGLGMGRKLMEVFINHLKKSGVPSLHLEVGKDNTGAIKFYERFGFKQICEYEYSIAFGITI